MNDVEKKDFAIDDSHKLTYVVESYILDRRRVCEINANEEKFYSCKKIKNDFSSTLLLYIFTLFLFIIKKIEAE